MPRLTVLMGVPASGKSTLARQIVRDYPGTIRVNCDSLRDMLHVGEWSKTKEKATRAIRMAAIKAGLQAGFDVVSDDTNLEPSIRASLKSIAREIGAEYVEDVVTIDYGQAVQRDWQRGHDGGRSVGEEVIKRFYLRALELGIYID